MTGISRLREWLAESYEERHVEIHVECVDPTGDGLAQIGGEDAEDTGPSFTTVVMLSEIAYSGPSEPSSTGDHSQSIIQHFGTGANLDEAVDQAMAQWAAMRDSGVEL